MLQYVDSFYCASNAGKETVVLRLNQEEPIGNSGSGDVDVRINEVSSVVLSHECAKQLALSILELLGSPNEDTSASTAD